MNLILDATPLAGLLADRVATTVSLHVAERDGGIYAAAVIDGEPSPEWRAA